MAQTTQDTSVLSDTTGKEVVGIKQAEDTSSSSPSVAVTQPQPEKTSQTSTDATSTTSSSHPSLVPLGSNHVQTSSVTPVAPHPKRFSAVNINKKFLEKNTASGSAASSSGSSAAKSGSAVSRPSVQPTSSHSRLVTTKLTASPAVTSSTAGWSRPSSVAPSPATNSPISTSPLPTAAASQLSSTAAPQLPHAGKVILPQPRANMAQPNSSQRDAGSAKPVWGNVKPPIAATTRLDIEPSDFPTAAEVANVASTARKHAKALEEAKAQSGAASKQLRSEEADAFRGVHLDPNVHHWDEMEEDDDNFLGGVIEFGDGRQYKIESSESLSGAQSKDDSTSATTAPVSKEDRFVDDFDRSWPKSRTSPASVSKDVPPSAPQSASPSLSPAVSHSPVDSSRVLFNERSNRLEPYSQAQRPQGAFNNKRSSFHDADAKTGPHNVQVLQKPPGTDFGSRSRRFSASNNGFNAGPPNGFSGDRQRDRRDMPPPSPRLTRGDHPPNAVHDTGGRDLDRGRRTSMGPPPVPAHASTKFPHDGGRQLPPHLSQVSPNIPPKRLPSRDSRFSPAESSTGLPSLHAGRIPPHSPAISHHSLNLLSPVAGPNSALPLSAPELDEVRKDVMHTAAERAKQRRLQEEQEREAQKERARRKAAELEEKIKAQEAEKAEKERQKQEEAEKAAEALAKEKEVVNLIEEAVKTVDTSKSPIDKPDSRKLLAQRPPPLKDVSPATDGPRSGMPRRTSMTARSVPLPSPALQTESWRARNNPVPPSPLPRQIQGRPSGSATFIASGPSAAEQVETIADKQDDLEVVDFSDMGKFVGVSESNESTKATAEPDAKPSGVTPRSARPVASDFFEGPTSTLGTTVPVSKKADFGAWRRKVSQEVNEPSPATAGPRKEAAADEKPSDSSTTAPPDQNSTEKSQPAAMERLSPDTSLAMSKESLSHQDQGQTVCLPQTSGAQRTPRAQTFYKESAMTALDDAMSRIKGVLSGMHAQDAPKESAANASIESDASSTRTATQPPVQIPVRTTTKERWVPPALRPRKFDDMDEPQEVFLFTMMQPPSPPRVDESVAVQLPTVSRPVEFIHKRQLQAFHRPPFQARMDILSFDPPVFDMNRRDLSLNDVLFRKPNLGPKTKFRYRVVIPRGKGLRVNIPSAPFTKPGVGGAFGRSTVADGASTWRKVAAPTGKADVGNDSDKLDTTSRSPPPSASPADANIASIPKSGEETPSKSEGNSAVRSRSQPKMPEGSAVAFIRDSRIDVAEVDKKPSVNFIVGSQLEEDTQTSSTVPTSDPGKTEVVPNGVVKLPPSTEEHTASSKVDNSDITADPVLVTPPTHHSTASWTRSSVSLAMKESPARAPDPEHLKAVWSQTSDKAGLHAVNSLEGIADDLTALPFTLQDVKSEDGETPPPSLPSAPSRMSLHEVTRAFQTVPTSSTTPSQSVHRATFSPPSTNAPVARPATASYSYSPVPQNGMRAYVPYGTPIMSHSPGPVMYGHPMASSPVPARMQMNGHTPLYSQPMWMTMPGSSQPHGSMMRPMASPYPAQLMAYPSPGYATQPPPPSMITPTTSQGQQNPASRGRGMPPVMSPVVSHAHPHASPAMYSSSPVMLHAVQVPPQNHYMPVAPGRGQPARADSGQMPAQQAHPVNGHHPPSHNGFNPTPAYPRPTW
ncbi:hypothetical protein CPC08DRAFT_32029 [Agrocybe pediades]|nr:hypothetical protein CPC08DRAFT_32029 [Agrocybe pediades]